MFLDYIMDVKPLEDQGLTNAEIADAIASATAGPMDPDESKSILQETGAVITDPVNIGQRSGSLITYYQSLADDDPSKHLIAWFIASVYDGVQARTDEYPKSVQFSQVEDSLPDDLKVVANKLIVAAGSRPRGTAIEQDVANAKAAYDQSLVDLQDQIDAENARNQKIADANVLRDKVTNLWNAHVVPVIDSAEPETDELVWKAGVQAMIDNWDSI